MSPAMFTRNNQIGGPTSADAAGTVGSHPPAVPARPASGEDEWAEGEIDRLEKVIENAGGFAKVLGNILGVDVEIVPAVPVGAPRSKADQARLLRPHCRNADNLDQCGGSGKRHCRACLVAAGITEEAA